MGGKMKQLALLFLLILICFSVPVFAVGPYIQTTQTIPTAYINDAQGQEYKAKFVSTESDTAENVTIDIDLPSGGFSYVTDSLSAIFKTSDVDSGTPLTVNVSGTDPVRVSFDSQLDLAQNQILELTYKIATNENVTAGSHHVISTFANYYDSSSTSYSEEDQEMLEVLAGEVSVSFTSISPSPFIAERGDQIVLEAKVENTGTGNLYNIDVNVNWETGFGSPGIISAESNITPTLVGDSYQITIDEIPAGESRYFRYNLTVIDYENFGLNFNAYNPVGAQNHPESIVFCLLVHQPDIVITANDVNIDYGNNGMMNIQIKNINSSGDQGSARNFKLVTNINSIFNVSNLAPGWSYSNGEFTYDANGGVIEVDDIVDLNFELNPINKYNTKTGTIYITPEYKNDIDQTLNYPNASATYSFLNVPTINLTQTVNSEATDGDNYRVFLAEEIDFEYRPAITNVDKWKNGQDIVFTDNFPADFDINDVTVTSGILNWVDHSVTWTLTPAQVALNPTMTVKTQMTGNPDLAGRLVSNTTTIGGTTIWDCDLSDSIYANMYLQSRNEEAIFIAESKYIDNKPAEGYYDVCGKDAKDEIEYRLEYNFHPSSGGTWTGSTLTDQLNQDQIYVADSAQYRINSGVWMDIPAGNIISTSPLTFDLGFLKDQFAGEDFVNGKAVSFKYKLQLTNASLALGTTPKTFVSETDLRIANTTGGAIDGTHFYQAVFVPISRAKMNIGIDLNTNSVTIGEELRATIDVDKLAPWDNNNLEITLRTNGNYQYKGNPSYTGFGLITPTENVIDANNVKFNFGNLEVNEGGTISFDLVKTDVETDNYKIYADLDFKDDLDYSFSDTDWDEPYYKLKGALSITANPDPIKITEETLTWDINVANIGGGTAYNVELKDTLKDVMSYVSSTIDGVNATPTTISILGATEIVWNLGDLGVGESKTINIEVNTSGSSTDFSNANNLYATADWKDRVDVYHQYLDTTLNNAPKFVSMLTSTFLKNSADNPIDLLEKGKIKLQVTNNAFTHNYNLILTQSLGETGFVYQIGTAKINSIPINDPVVSGTTLIWTFDSGETNYLAQLEHMAPGDTFIIEFEVQTGEKFNDKQKVQPSATWQRPEETGGILRSGAETGAEYRVPIHQPDITVTVTGKNQTLGDLSFTDSVIARANDVIEWRIAIQNSGDATAQNVILQNILPDNTSFISIFSGTTEITPGTEWQIANIPISTINYYYIESRFDGSCDVPKINTSNVRWGAAGSSSLTSPTDNDDTATLITQPSLDSVNVTFANFTTKDGRATITVRNSGAPLYNLDLSVDITDRFEVDGGMSYSSGLNGPTSQPAVGTDGNLLNWQWAGPIYAGTHTISFDIRDANGYCNDGSSFTPTNNVTYKNSQGANPPSFSNSFPDISETPAIANLRITKTPLVQISSDGSSVSWTIDIENIGNANATNVEVVEVLGDGFTYVGTTSPAPSNQVGNTLTWDSITINHGQTYTITLDATVQAAGDHTTNTTATEWNVDKSAKVDEETSKAIVALIDYAKTANYSTGAGNDPNADTFGEVINYKIQVDFKDVVNYENVVIKDTLPSGLGLASEGYITNGLTTITPNHSGKNLVWNLSDFAGLETVQIFYGARIADEGQTRGTNLTNQARMGFDINVSGDIFNFPDNMLQDAETFTLREPKANIVSRSVSPTSGSSVVAGQEIDHTIIVENNNLNETNVSQAYECKIVDTIGVGARIYDPTASLVIKKYNDSGFIATLTEITDYTSSFVYGTGVLTITLKNTTLGILQDKEYFEISYKTKIDDGIGADASIQHTAQLVEYYGQPSAVTGVKTYTDTNSHHANYHTVQSNSAFDVVSPVDREIKPGDVVTFDASITIPDGTSVYDISLTSNLPTGLSYVNGSSVGLNEGVSTYRDLTPTVTGSPDTGETITWAVELDNQDIINDTGSDLTLTITFDAAVLDSGFINDGDTKTADYDYDYNTVNGNGSTRTNYSPVSVNLNVIEPDLDVTMNVTSAGPYQAGDTVRYQLTVENTSTETAYDVRITDILPDNLTLKSTPTFDSGAAVFNQNGQELSWGSDDNLDIAPAETVIINIEATLDVEVEPDEIIQNNVSVTWDSQDGVVVNERSYSDTLLTPVQITVTDYSAFARNLISTPTYVIGETINYQLVVTLNKGTTDNVVVTDNLPNGVEFVSGSITPDGASAVQYSLTQQPNSGDTGTITWNFGTIIIPPTESNTITIDYTIRILNIVDNNANDPKTLSASMNYNNSADTNKETLPQDHNFVIKEPVLVVELSYPSGNYDAGDTITYTIKVWHSSTLAPYDVSAYDVEISNPIPTGMTYVNGSMSPAGLDGGGILTWDIAEINTTYDSGNPFILTYDVTLDASIEPREMLSENTTLSWTSLLGIVSGERDGSGGLNDYTSTDSSSLTIIDETDLTKQVVGSTTYSIGETITYTLVFDINEGTTEQIVIKDTLPLGMAYQSATIEKGNANITYVLNSEPTTGSTGEITWDLGTIVNPGNLDSADDRITISYTTIVQDIVDNQRGDLLTNTANLDYIDGEDNNHQITNKTETIQIIEPELTVTASILSSGPYDAGDTVTYQVTVSHTGASNATAYDVKITGVLPDGVSYDTYTPIVGDPGLPGFVGNDVIFGSFGSLALNLGETLTFNINATLDEEVEPLQLLETDIEVDYSTANGVNAEEREFTLTIPDTLDVTVHSNTSLSKSMLSGPQFAVGARTMINLTLDIIEGKMDEVIVYETLPLGMEFVNANILYGNGSISYTLSEQPLPGATGELKWNFGTVLNPGNADTNDDFIRIEIIVMIQDIPANTRGTVLTESSRAEYFDVFDQVNTLNVPDKSVTVIEPELSIDAVILSTGPYNDGDSVTYQVTVSHTGLSDAPAYDLEITTMLPPELTYNSYTANPDDPGVPNSIGGNQYVFGSNGNINLWLGESYTFNIVANLNTSVEPRQELSNTIKLIYSGVDGVISGERVYDPGDEVTKVFTTGDSTVLTKMVADRNLYSIGETVTYTLRLGIAEGTTEDVIIKDVLPTGLEYVSTLITQGNLAITYILNEEPTVGDTGEIRWNLNQVVNPDNGLNTDDFITVEYTAKVVDIVENSRGIDLVNTAHLEYLDGEGVLQTTSDETVTITVIEPELEVTACIISTGPYVAGDIVTYEISISHTGNSDATAYDLEITNILPDGLTFDSYVANPDDPGAPNITGNDPVFGSSGNIDLNEGDTYIFRIKAVLETGVEPGEILSNDVDLKYTSTNDLNSDEREYLTSLASPEDIIIDDSSALVKEVDGDLTYAIGEPIPFKLTLNITEGTTENVVVRDVLPVGMKYVNANITDGNDGISYTVSAEPAANSESEILWNFGTIVNPDNGDNSDDTIIIEYNAVIKDIVENVRGNVMTNAAQLEYTDGEGNPQSTGAESISVTIIEPELTITKTGPATIELNTPTSFTVQVENVGDSTAWQTKIIDTLPEEMRDNEPTITSLEIGDPARALSEVSPDDYDLSYDTSTGEWTITLKSNEARIETGETLTLVYNAILNNEKFNVDTVTNQVRIEEYFSTDTGISDEIRRYIGDGEDGSAEAEVLIHTPVVSTVTEVSKDIAKPGDVIHFKVVLTNNGNIDAVGLPFTSDMEEEFSADSLANVITESGDITVDPVGGVNGTGNISISNITIPASGGTVTIEWDITLKPILPSGTVVQNQATLTVPDYPVPLIIYYPDVTINSAPIISFENTDTDADDAPLLPGDIIIYTLTVSNSGNEQITNAIIKNLIPSNTVYIEGTTILNGELVADIDGRSPLTEGMSINTPDDPLGWLYVGEEAVVQFKVQINEDVSPKTIISNQATLIAEGEGSGPIIPVLSDDPDTKPIADPTNSVVGEHPIIDAQKIVTDENGGTLDPGDLLTYTNTITNYGTVQATAVILADRIPELTKYIPGTLEISDNSSSVLTVATDKYVISSTEFSTQDNDITTTGFSIAVGSIPPGGEKVITFQVKVDDGTDGELIVGQGIVSCEELPDEPTDFDGNDSNGDQPTEIVVGICPVLRVFKQVSDLDGEKVLTGDILEYTLTVKNIGNADALDVEIVDALPTGLNYNADSTLVNGVKVADDPGPISVLESGYNLGTVGPGETVTIKYQVTVSDELQMGTVLDTQASYVVNAGELTGLSDSDLDDGEETGNNSGNPNDDDPTRIVIGGNPGTTNISGKVWFDENTNMAHDLGELSEQNWVVEVLQKDKIVDSTLTNSDGRFEFCGIVPGNGYRIHYRNPETNVVWKEISDLSLLSGTVLDKQDLPIHPTGVVYNALMREPVEGAVVSLVGPAGFDPAEHLLSGQDNQITPADGMYRFDVQFAKGAPEGEYTVAITPPLTYSPAFPSTIIPPEEGVLNPPANPDPYLVSTEVNLPGEGEATVYYISFELTAASPEILHNHIPLDPILEDAILLKKTTSRKTVAVGDIVPYTITIENQTAALITPFMIKDKIPAGFKYVEGSAKIDGVAIELTSGRVLVWDNLTVQPDGTMIITYSLVVGTGVKEGNIYRNTVVAIHELTETNISNEAIAEVQLVGEPTFTKTAVFGKVFNDRNENGVQDEGEEGIAGVLLVTVSGEKVTTDAYGRYHFTDIEVKPFTKGTNYIVKVDMCTLPQGTVMITENPRIIRLTQGLVAKINFGVKLPQISK